MLISTEEKYKISYKKLFLNKNFYVIPALCNIEKNLNNIDSVKHFRIFNIEIVAIISSQFFMLKNSKYIETSNFNLYNCLSKNNSKIKIIEIMDIKVADKYQEKEIGRRLIEIIDEISQNNNVIYAIGELEKDNKDGTLQKRKNFFEKNGFKSWKNNKAKFSGWIIKKTYNQNQIV